MYAKDLCHNCYLSQWRTPEYNRRQNCKPENIEARRRYARSERGRQAARESQVRNDPDGSRMRERSHRSYLNHREELLDPAHVRARNLAKYGITPEEYDEMLARQNGRCAICGTARPTPTPTKKSFAVDHCHASGKVRGLLCALCNPGLGYFRDNPEILEKAIGYLVAHAA